MSKEYFRITYDGSELVNHEMDVRILMPALQAVSDLFEQANELLNPEDAK